MTALQNPLPSSTSPKWNFLKHPIIVMLIGSCLTYILIPFYTDYRLRREQKKELVDEMTAFDSDVMSKLNVLKTHLNLCIKDAKYLGDEFYARKGLMQQQANDYYLAFDKVAWSGLNNLKLRFRHYCPNRCRELDTLFNAYKENLIAATRDIDTLWNCTLRVPNGKMNTAVCVQVALRMNERHGRLLRQRYALVQELCGMLRREV